MLRLYFVSDFFLGIRSQVWNQSIHFNDYNLQQYVQKDKICYININLGILGMMFYDVLCNVVGHS